MQFKLVNMFQKITNRIGSLDFIQSEPVSDVVHDEKSDREIFRHEVVMDMAFVSDFKK